MLFVLICRSVFHYFFALQLPTTVPILTSLTHRFTVLTVTFKSSAMVFWRANISTNFLPLDTTQKDLTDRVLTFILRYFRAYANRYKFGLPVSPTSHSSDGVIRSHPASWNTSCRSAALFIRPESDHARKEVLQYGAEISALDLKQRSVLEDDSV